MASLLNSLTRWGGRRFSPAQKQRLRGLQGKLARLTGQSLVDLAQLYNTDKWGTHWYIPHYEHHFKPYRNRHINVLEIGIGGHDDPKAGGSSLRMWKSWFKHAEIHGIDLYDKRAHQEPRIHTYQGSQVDIPFLESVVAKIGEIQLIIDDGSHINEHVVTTFNALFPKLAVGGLYVIEDTLTSYWPDYGGSADDLQAPFTMMNRFKALADSINYREWKKNSPPDAFEAHVTGLHFYDNLIFIEKGVNDGKNPVGR